MLFRSIEIEWKCFDHVKNKGGRADCQNDFSTFKIMRKSQYLCWSQEMLLSYINDFQVANERHWNLITEKYAWMMESTNSTEFKELESSLPVRLQEKLDIINEIVKIQVSWMEDFSGRYPEMAKQARSIHTTEDTAINTSYETYLRGELSTYSEQTLSLYGNFVVGLYKDNQNLADIIMTNTANLYGYASLDDAENRI